MLIENVTLTITAILSLLEGHVEAPETDGDAYCGLYQLERVGCGVGLVLCPGADGVRVPRAKVAHEKNSADPQGEEHAYCGPHTLK